MTCFPLTHFVSLPLDPEEEPQEACAPRQPRAQGQRAHERRARGLLGDDGGQEGQVSGGGGGGGGGGAAPAKRRCDTMQNRTMRISYSGGNRCECHVLKLNKMWKKRHIVDVSPIVYIFLRSGPELSWEFIHLRKSRTYVHLARPQSDRYYTRIIPI